MTGQLDDRAKIVRLLQRTGFSAPPQAVDAALAAGFDATVDRIVSSAGAPATDPPRFASVRRPAKGDADAKKAYARRVRGEGQRLVLWWLERMVTAEPAGPAWVEKRTLLWHGHWATSISKVKSAAAMFAQNDTERRLGGGDFDAFARAMVRDPALMIWLDASGNTAKAPNENLGRELMEIFTLGVGHYSEDDVRQAARALTGWRVNRRADPPTARFVPGQHAGGTQQLLGVTKDFDASSLVDLLVSRPDSARYVATRMWHWLVAPLPPSAASLGAITAAYGSGRDLTAMFRAMLRDPAFADPDGLLVKMPIDYVVGMLRVLGLAPSTLSGPARKALLAGLQQLGQVPFEPPSVGGWPSGGAWLTTSAARGRVQLATRLSRAADLGALAAQPASARPDYLARELGVGSWTARTHAVLTGAASDPIDLMSLALVSPEYVVSR